MCEPMIVAPKENLLEMYEAAGTAVIFLLFETGFP